MRPIVPLLLVTVLSVISFGIFEAAYSYFRSEEMTKAEGRLSLYRASVTAELERFSHLSFVLSHDPYVLDTAKGGATSGLDRRLRGFAAQAGLDAIFLMTENGDTVSASNADTVGSFVGQNYSFRPYFRNAISGDQGRFYGIGATTGLPGYFIADPVRNVQGDILGVIAIKIDLSELQDSWRGSGEMVLLANRDGVVLLASNPAWQYNVLEPLTAKQRDEIAQARQFPGQQLETLAWSPNADGSAAISGDTHLYLTADALPHGWKLHYFSSDDRAVALSWLVTAAAVFLAILALVAVQIQRTQRMGRALKRSEHEEAMLRQTNARLAVEIDDRRTAERRLKRTQNELERTSRLAALGQLSASVTHELGQPITAMRNHLVTAEISGSAPVAFTSKIGALVERMEGITRQLKFFARTDGARFEEVDLDASAQAALALVEPNISKAGVDVDVRWSQSPVVFRGNKLRVEQVLTNLLRNAVDAVDGVEDPQLSIRIGATQEAVWFEVEDNGHGLGDTTLEALSEPFVTTRESGHGMGLGLAISSEIVKDHGGKMRAENGLQGGAIFRVDFPATLEDDEGTAASAAPNKRAKS